MDHIVKIISTRYVTHNVRQFRLQKPAGFTFTPGQATELSVNQPGWKDKKNPFTFTCLTTDPYLEFTIKIYPDSAEGVTNQLSKLTVGDELILRDAWGAIEYKGPGYFIAGGAGITPFVAILRSLHKENKLAGNTLFFSNKTAADIIYEKELTEMLGTQAIYLLTKENKAGYQSGYLDKNFLQQNITDFHKHFYVCGPDKMVQDITELLQQLGADVDAVIFEK